MEREAVLVGIDVGTSKVCALIGEVSRDGRLTIMGHGTVPASGLKKGVVINIDQTVRSIADAVERAERLSGWKIDRAFVGVGGHRPLISLSVKEFSLILFTQVAHVPIKVSYLC